MFTESFVKKIKNIAIFVLIYTLIFILFFSTLSYTLPFVLAFLIALWIKPLNKFLNKKLKLSLNFSSLLSTLLFFIIIFFIITTIVFKISLEIRDILNNLPDMNKIINFVQVYITNYEHYFNELNPELIDKFKTELLSLLSNTYSITVTILKTSISFAIKLPKALLVMFITLIATYFFSTDLAYMKNKFLSIFSDKSKDKVVMIWNEANKMFTGYIRAYSFIVFLSFTETLIGFSILNIKYALSLSIISAICDVLPIIGIGVVYFAVGIFYFLSKKYIICIGIIVLYLIVTILRQILEPKIVSASLGLKPIAVLAAIFIGIMAYGFLGMIYLLFLVVFYRILKKSEVL
ncbi:sporulation integral membrane protein YtvI [Caloramator quimbayensis]|uniref:Sporulation integral membrane protein YtvI n=1 Tax=Caloramator quimbayensis TaxID=1147123 RepID=A0A1T4Y6M9_9CLOT|nr:sporulation integral membrane protein YtvI [Caloramator quimbayensis]SKA97492.1 sporulation integral membrane protein YtvI [Caloramator quimbayensis]